MLLPRRARRFPPRDVRARISQLRLQVAMDVKPRRGIRYRCIAPCCSAYRAPSCSGARCAGRPRRREVEKGAPGAGLSPPTVLALVDGAEVLFKGLPPFFGEGGVVDCAAEPVLGRELSGRSDVVGLRGEG